ncbi:MAG: class I SAM-dependent DNA methyltransferase [Thermotogota bacterium]
MYKENLFNGWAEKYDKDVYNTEKFPFKNYKDVLFKIYNQIPEERSKVLDLGCGTGELSNLLSNNVKLAINACDFSEKMLELAKRKNNGVDFFKFDINDGFESINYDFDYIVTSYVIHHFDLDKKASIIKEAFDNNENLKKFIIGDIMFENKEVHEKQKELWKGLYDEQELYIEVEELKSKLDDFEVDYKKINDFAGVLVISKE